MEVIYYYDVHINLGTDGYSVGITDTEEWDDFDSHGVNIEKVAPYLQEKGDVYLIDSVECISEEQFNEWFIR